MFDAHIRYRNLNDVQSLGYARYPLVTSNRGEAQRHRLVES